MKALRLSKETKAHLVGWTITIGMLVGITALAVISKVGTIYSL